MKTKEIVVDIRVREVGQNFGCEGQVVARNHRVLATTRLFPFGCRASAYQAAERLATEKGYYLNKGDES